MDRFDRAVVEMAELRARQREAARGGGSGGRPEAGAAAQ